MKYTAAVVTISDKCFRGERVDTSGPSVCAILAERGWSVEYTVTVPDDSAQIRAELRRCTDQWGVALVVTTGGTGFSPRDVTPEAALAVMERETPGIAEAMRAESMRITPRGCLSRAVAGIRGQSLIVTLPGSEKAARENLLAVIDPIRHGVEMLQGSGSADCGEPAHHHHHHDQKPVKKAAPSMDLWMQEAKADPDAGKVGMYLTHTGVVRVTARASVRDGVDAPAVKGMRFSYDEEKVAAAVDATRDLAGIYYVRLWLNEGELQVGEDLMRILIGGDIRPHVVHALQFLMDRIKGECVTEQELTD